jgi:uncharacterized protein (DUF2147 family)
MKCCTTFLLLFCLVMKTPAQITGRWKTIDDNTGEPKAIVEIFEKSGLYFGKVVQVFPRPGRPADPVCEKCDPSDPRYNKKVVGMEILKDLQRNGSMYEGGNILDPENGRVYRCKVWREGDQLKVRGYWGPFWRTQTWLKIS